jgi:ABC-type multidrug transport system fused ATPase/permease subunit
VAPGKMSLSPTGFIALVLVSYVHDDNLFLHCFGDTESLGPGSQILFLKLCVVCHWTVLSRSSYAAYVDGLLPIRRRPNSMPTSSAIVIVVIIFIVIIFTVIVFVIVIMVIVFVISSSSSFVIVFIIFFIVIAIHSLSMRSLDISLLCGYTSHHS